MYPSKTEINPLILRRFRKRGKVASPNLLSLAQIYLGMRMKVERDLMPSKPTFKT